MFNPFKSFSKIETPQQPQTPASVSKSNEELKSELIALRAKITEEKINYDDPRREEIDQRIGEIEARLDTVAANDAKYMVQTPSNALPTTPPVNVWEEGYTGGNTKKDTGSSGERKFG